MSYRPETTERWEERQLLEAKRQRQAWEKLRLEEYADPEEIKRPIHYWKIADELAKETVNRINEHLFGKYVTEPTKREQEAMYQMFLELRAAHHQRLIATKGE